MTYLFILSDINSQTINKQFKSRSNKPTIAQFTLLKNKLRFNEISNPISISTRLLRIG